MTSTIWLLANGVIRFHPAPRRAAPCTYCTRGTIATCDFRTAAGPCRKRLCGQCAVRVGGERHHCRAHGLRREREVRV